MKTEQKMVAVGAATGVVAMALSVWALTNALPTPGIADTLGERLQRLPRHPLPPPMTETPPAETMTEAPAAEAPAAAPDAAPVVITGEESAKPDRRWIWIVLVVIVVIVLLVMRRRRAQQTQH